MINGATYHYDRTLDVIFKTSYEHTTPFNRTQVEQSVDLCIESTTWCNWACGNCFSNSAIGKPGRHVDVEHAISVVESSQDEIIRVCVTGGEPLTHPRIEDLLTLPSKIEECGFVLNTNGTLRPDLDTAITNNRWLAAVSLHGRKDAHEKYSNSDKFGMVTKRIESLAKQGVVHIYTVLHDSLSSSDLDWLFRFRDEVGVDFLRFILPRNFGRFRPLINESLITEVEERVDHKSGIKTQASITRFMTVDGHFRLTN